MILYDTHARPHDRVPLKEMKADWHACLDNKVGFKVSNDVIFKRFFSCISRKDVLLVDCHILYALNKPNHYCSIVCPFGCFLREYAKQDKFGITFYMCLSALARILIYLRRSSKSKVKTVVSYANWFTVQKSE